MMPIVIASSITIGSASTPIWRICSAIARNHRIGRGAILIAAK
jgi:hypothetical protein